jgi:hypothetical protein
MNPLSGRCMSDLADPRRVNQLPQAEILYVLNPNVDLEKLLTEINLNLVEAVNQITFCRIGLAKELIKLKIKDKAVNADENTKKILKKKYENIQEMKNRNLVELFSTLDQTNQMTCKLQQYNQFEGLQGFLFGR